MIDTFLRALPKVELHVHLVGSASVPTVLALARLVTSPLVRIAHAGVDAALCDPDLAARLHAEIDAVPRPAPAG